MNWIEILGTGASVLVAISLTIRSMKGLRIVNTLGAAFFAVYGFLIGSWPVLGLNSFIVVINLYYLVRMAGETAHFQILPAEQASGLVKSFTDFYGRDIRTFQPDFRLPEPEPSLRGGFILRESVPISLVLFRKLPDGKWEILLDYAIPAFRDLKNARYFYREGFRVLFPGETPVFVIRSGVKAHRAYLRKVGFSKDERDDSLFSLRTAGA